MQLPIPALRRVAATVRMRARSSWSWYRSRPRKQQIGIAVGALALLIALLFLLRLGGEDAAPVQARTVTLASVGSLTGTGSGTSIVGSVRSVTEAKLLAQNGGTVRRVRTTLGATVPAGFVIAELDNASEAAAVLQAEGAYDAAIASRNITSLQSGNAQTSFAEAQRQARDAYRSAYTALDTTLENDVDTFFGGPTPYGARLLINPGPTQDLPRRRDALDDLMDAWQQNLATADSRDPELLLRQATADAQAISDFLVELSRAANARDSRATPTQLAALARARATVDAQLSALSAARNAYNASKTGAAVAGGSTSAQGTQLAAANASVKSALGTLRAAQAAYEKTRIRATIGGTVNYLPIKVGQYVNNFEHVATVAQNGALEIVAYAPEEGRDALAVGMTVQVEGGHTGTITAVAPALDPITKQIEVRIAVDATPDLVNGQSVRITLPNEVVTESSPTSASSTAPLLLPLTAVKLLPESRAVFTVDTEGRIVVNTVTIGDVIGDRIEVLSGVSPDMRIVTDVRGLAEGQKVQIAPAPGS